MLPGAAPSIHSFASRAALADALASAIAKRLAAAIGARGKAGLAVSGGTTPALFLAALSRHEIDWAKVTVTLVDERFVPPDSPRSNAGLVRRALVQGPAAAARFVPLYRPVSDVVEACQLSSDVLAKLTWPLDAAVLGMGADGHTASFFPDADNLPTLLDPDPKGFLHVVMAKSAGEPRLTLTLSRIASAHFIALHIEGDEKRAVFDAALEGASTPPIRAVLEHAAQPVQVYWAP